MSFIQTFYTDRFNLPPKADEVNILDIALGLSRSNRFNGHSSHPYNVAQHSIICSYYPQLTPEQAMEALLHDAGEAYIGDMPRPAKALMPQYYDLENAIMDAVAERFNIPNPMTDMMRHIDNTILMTEKQYLLKPSKHKWSVVEHPLDAETLSPDVFAEINHEIAFSFFLLRFNELSDALGRPEDKVEEKEIPTLQSESDLTTLRSMEAILRDFSVRKYNYQIMLEDINKRSNQ
jgi:hypothetical protein